MKDLIQTIEKRNTWVLDRWFKKQGQELFLLTATQHFKQTIFFKARPGSYSDYLQKTGLNDF